MNIIELHSLSYAYPGAHALFTNLNLTFPAGSSTALTGPNGAGKSTLLMLIMGLVKPESGTIALWGKKMASEEDFREARRKTGFLFQDPDHQLLCPSVEEDIAFTLLNRGMKPKEAQAKVHAISNELHISHLLNRVPFHLSRGEKKLVALAGALVSNPELLLLDEPTDSLSPEMTNALVALLKRYQGTMLIATHDPILTEQLCTDRRDVRP